MMRRLRETFGHYRYHLRRRLGRMALERASRAIFAAPPLALRPGPVRVVSMVSTHDVPMYLVAIRSLYRFLPGGGITVLDDGTLTAADRAAITRALGAPDFARIADIPTGACPRGGCWERLLHVLDASADSYVIQMDSDVLTFGPVPEVVAAIEANAAFTLNSEPRFDIVPVEQAAAQVSHHDPRHLQFLAEQTLPSLPPGLGRLYVRGSAGFAGFARGGATRATAEAFSAAMAGRLGARWSEWGTEQVASNYIVANSPGGHVLPWDRYRCYYDEGLPPNAALAHFIGTWRFEGGVYLARTRQVLAELSA